METLLKDMKKYKSRITKNRKSLITELETIISQVGETEKTILGLEEEKKDKLAQTQVKA